MTESDKELLTVIIPCINEEESIALTVEDVLSYEEEIDVRLELLLIDDGSTDATLDIMRALAEEHSNVRVQVNERNLGVGRSVMNAYEQIDDASWITVVPGDNEFHFASIHLADHARQGATNDNIELVRTSATRCGTNISSEQWRDWVTFGGRQR